MMWRYYLYGVCLPMMKKTVLSIFCLIIIGLGNVVSGISFGEPMLSETIERCTTSDGTEVVDQQQTSSSGMGCPFFSTIWLAQGFIPGLMSMTCIEVDLFKVGSVTSPITVSIRDSLTGSDLTSATVDGSLVSTYSQWIIFDVSDISLVPGNQYYLVIRSSGGSIVTYYCAMFDTENPYDGGEAWGSIDSGSTWGLIEDYYPEYPDPDACFITYGFDEAPGIPEIDGTLNGNIGEEYQYTMVSTDPENHAVMYSIDWDDGSTTGWIGPYASGEQVIQSHQWSKKGSYTIKVKARDSYLVESDWGTLDVSMPTPVPFMYRMYSWILDFLVSLLSVENPF